MVASSNPTGGALVVGRGTELDTVGRQWRPCGVTWGFGPEQSSRTVVVIKLRRTSAFISVTWDVVPEQSW